MVWPGYHDKVDFATAGLNSEVCSGGYSGNNCNSTSGTVCASGSTCNVCSTCCKPYSQGTCEACVVDECDSLNVCSADASKCNTCSSCCKSYLEGSQEDCNLCVEHTCN